MEPKDQDDQQGHGGRAVRSGTGTGMGTEGVGPSVPFIDRLICICAVPMKKWWNEMNDDGPSCAHQPGLAFI